MALYKHVANKEDVLDGMVDVVVGDTAPPAGGTDWKNAIRQRILSARQTLLRQPWASRVLESRENPTPRVMAYMDSTIGIFRDSGFSTDPTHHVMHAKGSRIFGFTQELFNDSPSVDPEASAAMPPEIGQQFPHITELVAAISHDQGPVVGPGCDDHFEFEFALDLLLNGIEELRQREFGVHAPGGRAGAWANAALTRLADATRRRRRIRGAGREAYAPRHESSTVVNGHVRLDVLVRCGTFFQVSMPLLGSKSRGFGKRAP